MPSYIKLHCPLRVDVRPIYYLLTGHSVKTQRMIHKKIGDQGDWGLARKIELDCPVGAIYGTTSALLTNLPAAKPGASHISIYMKIRVRRGRLSKSDSSVWSNQVGVPQREWKHCWKSTQRTKRKPGANLQSYFKECQSFFIVNTPSKFKMWKQRTMPTLYDMGIAMMMSGFDSAQSEQDPLAVETECKSMETECKSSEQD